MKENIPYRQILNNVADPFVFRWEGKYYLFCTGDFVPVYVSNNLTDWEKLGTAIKPEEGDEDILCCYAPEVTYFGGKFYMCFSPAGNEHRLFVSDNLTNGYVPITDKRFNGIDGSFYLKNGKITVTRTANVKRNKNKDGIYVKKASSAEKLASDKGWKKIAPAYLNGWTEGPFINERNGYEYLTFTGNHFLSRGYRIEYCYKSEKTKKFSKKLPLLISTEKDFYGLGHSSTAVSPNLDGRIIAYHDLILDENGDYVMRNLNLSSLISDGKNLFANPSLDYGDSEKTLSFTEKDFPENSKEYVLPVNSTERYSAELTFEPTLSTKIKIGEKLLAYENGFLIFDKHKKRVTPLPLNALSVLKIENGKTCKIYFNGQKVFCLPPIKAENVTLSNAKLKFATISPHSENSSDKTLIKAVPSRFTACSCNEDAQEKTVGDVNYLKGELSYSINVLKSGNYRLIVNAIADKKEEFFINAQGQTLKSSLEKCNGRKVLGEISLEKGLATLKIKTNALFCDLELSHSTKEEIDNNFLQKTAVENYRVFLNETNLYDYCVKVKANASQKKYTGGVMLRASDYSYFDNQQKESYYGYLLSCHNGKVMLYKTSYNKKLVACKKVGKGEKVFNVKLLNDKIEVFLNRKTVISYVDANAYFYGKTGILSLNENPDYEAIIESYAVQ